MADRFDVHASKLLDAIQLCRAKALLVPALILLYSAIDGMAWLSLPEQDETVRRGDFESWVEKYFMPVMRIQGYTDVTAEDLYAARCALVHTQTAEALLARDPLKSTAREIYYREQDQTGMVNLMANTPRPALFIAPSSLFAALESAVKAFRHEIANDPILASRVSRKIGKHFVQCNFL